MLLNELTQLGDKIDIQLIQQLQMQESGEIVEGDVRTYKSCLFDYISDTEIEIAMPTENGRMVLFQIGLRCKMLFYSKKGLFTCSAVVQKRYKKDNLFVLAMQLTSEPVKLQRREFFRIDCILDMRYIPITPEIAKLETTEQLFAEIQKPEYIDCYEKSTMLDLSGGGLRFQTGRRLDVGTYQVSEIRLNNERMDQTFYLATKIISCEQMQNDMERYICRGQFFFKNLRDRENIVRFVFDEERRIRRKETR